MQNRKDLFQSPPPPTAPSQGQSSLNRTSVKVTSGSNSTVPFGKPVEIIPGKEFD